MPGAAVPTCLLLLAVLSVAAADSTATKTPANGTKETATKKPLMDLSTQETKNFESQSSPKRQIRKFDFDDEFARYLGLASQDETSRFLAGDRGSSYRTPVSQEGSELNVFPQLRLAGSTPASFAYFTQIYPDDDSSGGNIRIEHFNPVTHPRSLGRENGQVNEDYSPPRYAERSKNQLSGDSSAESLQTLQPPPTSRSYFGRLSNKPKSIEFTSTDFIPQLNKLRAPDKQFQKPKDYEEESPDYKTGYRQFGMYHKFHEEDLYPKKTSTEWIPTNPKQKAEQNPREEDEESEANDFEDYADDYPEAPVKSEQFHVQSEHDDEVGRIKDSIENDPPYSNANYDLAEKQGASIGNTKSNEKGSQEEEDGKDYPEKTESAASAEPNDQIRKHKRPRKHGHKHKKHHFQLGSEFRNSHNLNVKPPFPNNQPHPEFQGPSFEFRNPVNSFISSPYITPPANQPPLRPYQNPPEPYLPPQQNYQAPPEPTSYRTAPVQYRSPPEHDPPSSPEAEKESSYEEQPLESSDEPGNPDTGSGHEPEDLDEDYRIITEAGQKEHAERTKDLDRRLPVPDGKVYGSFESFDSQLEPNKKFHPFVQYPFDREREKLKAAVDELIEGGKIADR